jgi:hypothetical protein
MHRIGLVFFTAFVFGAFLFVWRSNESLFAIVFFGTSFMLLFLTTIISQIVSQKDN